ncbi:hypothetical protein HDU97_004129 [Phlyctochytrium planicorne]|nr:hypothetical protein HDU97_004129 [Phlyctochytrium planicorne]
MTKKAISPYKKLRAELEALKIILAERDREILAVHDKLRVVERERDEARLELEDVTGWVGKGQEKVGKGKRGAGDVEDGLQMKRARTQAASKLGVEKVLEEQPQITKRRRVPAPKLKLVLRSSRSLKTDEVFCEVGSQKPSLPVVELAGQIPTPSSLTCERSTPAASKKRKASVIVCLPYPSPERSASSSETSSQIASESDELVPALKRRRAESPLDFLAHVAALHDSSLSSLDCLASVAVMVPCSPDVDIGMDVDVRA